MKKYGFAFLAALFLITVAFVPIAGAKGDKCCNNESKSALELKMQMRKLWEEHIAWTKLYIVSAVNGLDSTDKYAARLLKNQEDIGNAIKPVYGDAAGDKLTALLKDHILLAAELVKAAKAGDSAAAAEAEKKWYANGDDIAGFLSGANPNWTKAALKEMMDTHLSLTKAIAVAALNKDWDADIKATDSNHDHILMMADALSAGIVKQFPKKFAK
jgi:hypothetical protein